jgi:hypothetical protein
MAEHFYGRQHTVHTSNGGGKEMLRAWIQTGETFDPTPLIEEVLEFLRGRLLRGDGFRSFSLDPPPPQLAGSGRLRCFAAMVAGFAYDLARGCPDPRLDVSWGRELELVWLAKMLDLYDLVSEALPPDVEPLNALTPTLTYRDRVRCEYHRLSDRLTEHDRRVERGEDPRDLRVKLSLVDRLLAALAEQESSSDRTGMTAHYLGARGDLLLEMGDRAGGIEALCEAAAVEPDGELRQALAEYVAALKEESSR